MKKCGYILIIGRPNVGKSTLLNSILKYKISITSRKPQTTKYKIIGIKTTDRTQFIYIDTPGININKFKYTSKFINKFILKIINTVNIILFIVELGKWTEIEDYIVNIIKNYKIVIFLVINKVDKKKSLEAILFIKSIQHIMNFYKIIYVSSKHGHNINTLELNIEEKLPQSKYFIYKKSQITDKSNTFIISEIIREKVIRNVGDEIPYQIYTKTDYYKINKEKKIADIYVSIFVNKKSQKGIIIGFKGMKIKKINIDSRIDIERLINMKINLKTHVRVKKII